MMLLDRTLQVCGCFVSSAALTFDPTGGGNGSICTKGQSAIKTSFSIYLISLASPSVCSPCSLAVTWQARGFPGVYIYSMVRGDETRRGCKSFYIILL